MNKWKALPRVPGVRESQLSAASQLSRKHTAEYTEYIFTYRKRLFLPDLVSSGSVSCPIWDQCYIVQSDNRVPTVKQKNTEEYKIRPALPTRRDPIQSNWMTSFLLDWVSANKVMLRLTICWTWQRRFRYGVYLITRSTLNNLAHTKLYIQIIIYPFT